MKIVFLCGGVGKRMFPLSEDKFMLKFMGKTLLHYQIEQARKAGINEFIFIGNPDNVDKIKAVTRNMSGADFAFVVQEKPSGMANALEAAKNILPDDPIMVVNPNDVLESIGDRIDLVIDGGITPGGKGSTILDVTDRPPSILREGMITPEDIRHVLA